MVRSMQPRCPAARSTNSIPTQPPRRTIPAPRWFLTQPGLTEPRLQNPTPPSRATTNHRSRTISGISRSIRTDASTSQPVIPAPSTASIHRNPARNLRPFSRQMKPTSARWPGIDQGNLLAGSDGSGLVYRISSAGKGYVLFDSPLREVTSIAVGEDGTIYAACVGDKGHNALPPLAVQGGATITITVVQPGSLQAANSSTSIPEGSRDLCAQGEPGPAQALGRQRRRRLCPGRASRRPDRAYRAIAATSSVSPRTVPMPTSVISTRNRDSAWPLSPIPKTS